MILAGENRSVRGTSCRDTLFTKKLTLSNLELNSGLRGERPVPNRLRLSTVMDKFRETVIFTIITNTCTLFHAKVTYLLLV